MCPDWDRVIVLHATGLPLFCLSYLISITHSMTWVLSIPGLLESNTMRWKECQWILRRGIFFWYINCWMNGESDTQHLHSQRCIWLLCNSLYCFFFPLSLSHLATGEVAVIDSIYCLIASVAFKKNPGLQAQFWLHMELVQRDGEWRQQSLARHRMMPPFQSHFPLMRVLTRLSSLGECHAASGVMAALDG